MGELTILGIRPTLAFWVSLLPVPFLVVLNIQTAGLLLKLHRLQPGGNVKPPKIYHQGKRLGLISGAFAITPALVEWRVFVQNPIWVLSYLAGGLLGILGLRMVKAGLKLEISRARKAGKSKRGTSPSRPKKTTRRQTVSVPK